MLRKIQITDIPALIELGRRMHEESFYRQFPYNEEKCRVMAEHFLFNDNFFSTIYDDGIMKGMMLGYIADHTFCDIRVASDFLLFVAPEYRNSSIGLRILKEFKTWAISKGCNCISLGNTTNVKSDKVVKLYERIGLTRVGYLCIGGLNG